MKKLTIFIPIVLLVTIVLTTIAVIKGTKLIENFRLTRPE